MTLGEYVLSGVFSSDAIEDAAAGHGGNSRVAAGVFRQVRASRSCWGLHGAERSSFMSKHVERTPQQTHPTWKPYHGFYMASLAN